MRGIQVLILVVAVVVAMTHSVVVQVLRHTLMIKTSLIKEYKKIKEKDFKSRNNLVIEMTQGKKAVYHILQKINAISQMIWLG